MFKVLLLFPRELRGGLKHLKHFLCTTRNGSPSIWRPYFYIEDSEKKNMNEYVQKALKRNGVVMDDRPRNSGKKKNISISMKLKKSKYISKAEGHNAGTGGSVAEGYG